VVVPTSEGNVSILSHRAGDVVVVTIDRPEVRNAVDRPTADGLEAAVLAADADPTVGALVLTGAGGAFCAGADLHAFDDPARRNRLERTQRAPMGPTRLDLRVPTIAAIEGPAVAGGLELALWCDLRVVASDARLGVLCRRWGVPLIDGGTVRLPRIVGLGIALDLILTGREIDGDEALRVGLATQVVPPGEALDAALRLATQLAAFPRRTLQADLASARGAFDGSLDEALLVEHDRGVAALLAGGATEGVAAFRAGAGRHGTGAGTDAGGGLPA
jgi:enoyl-CoA hydratase